MQSSKNMSKTSVNTQEIFSEKVIQDWLLLYLANILGIDPTKIDIEVPYDRYGLDSSITIGMLSDIEDWLHCSLPPTLVYEYPSIQSLAKYLASLVSTVDSYQQ